MWNQDERVRYAIVAESLVYGIEKEENITFFMPDNADDLKAVMDALTDYTAQKEKKMRLAVISEEQKDKIEALYPDRFTFAFDRDDSDYVYEVQSMMTFSGKRFHGKKNHINKFKKTYEYTYEQLDDSNIEECRQMKDRWAETKVSDDEESLETELKAVDIALDNYHAFGFRGGLIRIDGEVKAFTLGEKVTEDTFVTHVEKAMDDVAGLYTMMCHEFAINTISDCTYVNREEDLGIEGLRKSKLSYHPVMLVDKYYAEEK